MMPVDAPTFTGAGRPDVRVWLTLDEAAATLGQAVSALRRRISRGEIESRFGHDGSREVLVRLPSPPRDEPELTIMVDEEAESASFQEEVEVQVQAATEPAPVPAPDLAEQTESVEQTLLPLMQAMRMTRPDDVRRARRSARMGWTAAAVMMLASGSGAAIAARALTAAHDRARNLSDRLEDLTQAAHAASTEKNQLRTELADVMQALTKAESELVVERRIEDTLLKAAIASHNATSAEPKQAAVADISN